MLVDFGVYWPQVTNASSILHTFLSMAAAWNWASVLQFVVQRNGHVTVRPSPYFWSVLSARQRMLENTTNQNFYRQYFDSVVAAFGRAAEEHAYTYEELIALEDNVVPGLRAALLSPEWSTLENSSLDAIVSKTRNPFSATEWESNLRSNFNFSDGSVLSISVEHTMFFVRFFSLVASEGESQMACYVGWVVVQALSLLASSEMVTKYYVGDGVIASREHALFCANLAHVYMGVAFYADHQAREVIGSVLQDVFAVETHVQTAFRSSMKGSPFYSAVPSSMVGKEALVQSLKLVKSLNADKLNNMYKDFSDMGDNVLDNVRRAVEGRQLTEADTSLPDFVNNGSARFSFSPHRGYFKLLPIALEKPFYEPGALMVVKYATIGGEVADVFSSAAFAGSPEAFDRKLQLAFTLKSTCFFGTQVLMRHLTLEDIELVRRVTSLRVILAALMVSNQGRMRSALLAGYESWTDFELLLFFWCFVQCGSVNGRRRCNGPLSMVDQFSRVFGCKKGDSMYTGRDCSI
ncbi:hypothetical protein V5799_021429 [Amblyomma americanum]|uniref:Uncharacterized protein n=1 Tax=Amblyomma americanum TaxID=6943 RepID=A0AAQ4FPW4_AMBAM